MSAEVLEQLDPNMLPLIFKYVDACSPELSPSVPESKLQAVLQISKYLSKWSEALSMGIIPDEDTTNSSSGQTKLLYVGQIVVASIDFVFREIRVFIYLYIIL